MARAFKDLIVQEADGRLRLTFRARDGTAVLEDVTVEIASTVLQEGDKWGALAANQLLELDEDGVPQAIAPEFTPAAAPAALASGERMSAAFAKLAAAVTALMGHLEDRVVHITAAERQVWDGAAHTANAAQTSANTAQATANAAQASANAVQVTANAAQASANTAQVTANAAMPKSGGAFTGNITAYSANRSGSCLRNSEVRTSSATGTLQSTDKIVYVRK